MVSCRDVAHGVVARALELRMFGSRLQNVFMAKNRFGSLLEMQTYDFLIAADEYIFIIFLYVATGYLFLSILIRIW